MTQTTVLGLLRRLNDPGSSSSSAAQNPSLAANPIVAVATPAITAATTPHTPINPLRGRTGFDAGSSPMPEIPTPPSSVGWGITPSFENVNFHGSFYRDPAAPRNLFDELASAATEVPATRSVVQPRQGMQPSNLFGVTAEETRNLAAELRGGNRTEGQENKQPPQTRPSQGGTSAVVEEPNSPPRKIIRFR